MNFFVFFLRIVIILISHCWLFRFWIFFFFGANTRWGEFKPTFWQNEAQTYAVLSAIHQTTYDFITWNSRRYPCKSQTFAKQYVFCSFKIWWRIWFFLGELSPTIFWNLIFICLFIAFDFSSSAMLSLIFYCFTIVFFAFIEC